MNTKRIVLVTAVLCIAALGAIGTKGQDSHTTLPQFDVPPIEVSTPWFNDYVQCLYSTGAPECIPPKLEPITSPTCADKSRFLLMSQDGVWHCLALSFLVQQTRTTIPTLPKAGVPGAPTSWPANWGADCISVVRYENGNVHVSPDYADASCWPEEKRPKPGTLVEIPKSVTPFRYMLDGDTPYLTIDNYGTIVVKNCTIAWAVLGESLAISCTPGGNKVEGTLYLKPSEPKP